MPKIKSYNVTYSSVKPKQLGKNSNRPKSGNAFSRKFGVKALVGVILAINLVLFFSTLLEKNMLLGLSYEQSRLNSKLNKSRAEQQELQALVAERSSISRAESGLASALGYVQSDFSEILAVDKSTSKQLSLR